MLTLRSFLLTKDSTKWGSFSSRRRSGYFCVLSFTTWAPYIAVRLFASSQFASYYKTNKSACWELWLNMRWDRIPSRRVLSGGRTWGAIKAESPSRMFSRAELGSALRFVPEQRESAGNFIFDLSDQIQPLIKQMTDFYRGSCQFHDSGHLERYPDVAAVSRALWYWVNT